MALKYFCCSSCCEKMRENSTVRYTKLTQEESCTQHDTMFQFPQTVGSKPCYPPMFMEKTVSKRLDSPHALKVMQVVREQPKAQPKPITLPKRALQKPPRSAGKIGMQEPLSNLPRWRMESPHAKTLARITGSELSVQHKVQDRYDRPVLQFSLEYDVCHSILTVHLLAAFSLPSMDRMSGASDPYVVIILYPSDQRVTSKVVDKCLNPVFDEKFQFRNVYPSDIGTMILYFTVYDHDKVTKDDKIGKVTISLDDVDLSGSMLTYDIERRSKQRKMSATENKGIILLSLCFDDRANTLEGIIVRLGNLAKFKLLSDPYVMVQLLIGKESWKQWKSSVKKSTLDPVYRESFHFSLQDYSIKDCQLLVTVYDSDHVTRDGIIGMVCIGADATQEDARKHWEEMLMSAQSVCRWHSILPASSVEPR